MAYKIAFFDIDNTLYDWRTKQWVRSGIDAVIAAKKKGLKVFLASARPFASQYDFGSFDLGVEWDGYIASCGSIAVAEGKTVKKTLLPPEDAYRACEVAKRLNLTLEVVCPNERFLIAPGDTYLENYHGTYSDIVPPVRPYRGEECTGLLLYAPEEYDHFFFEACPHLIYYRFHECGVDIMPEEHRKGAAIQAIIDHYGFKKEEAISFGDDTQDISMRDSSYFVCVGNGKDNVKEAADWVCGDIAEDGLAKALHELGVL